MSDYIKLLDLWIVKSKRDAHEQYIKSSDSNELQNYIDSLQDLNDKTIYAIKKGNIETLRSIGWPDELIAHIKDMESSIEMCDTIRQAFTVLYYNMSPRHQDELIEQIGGLR